MFVKFPQTPYLWDESAHTSREDKQLSQEETLDFLKNELVIEEKVDGANLGFHLENGEILYQNRGSYIYEPYLGQWENLNTWQATNWLLRQNIRSGLIYFGEWCYLKHSIFYNNLPNCFLGFDVYDINNNTFLSSELRDRIFIDIGLPPINRISRGVFTLKELNEMLNLKSIYGNSNIEGLYLRHEENGKLIARAKYVNEAFRISINNHWSKSKKVRNIVNHQARYEYNNE